MVLWEPARRFAFACLDFEGFFDFIFLVFDPILCYLKCVLKNSSENSPLNLLVFGKEEYNFKIHLFWFIQILLIFVYEALISRTQNQHTIPNPKFIRAHNASTVIEAMRNG